MKRLLVVAALFPSLALGAAATWAPAEPTMKCALPGRGTYEFNCRSVTATCAAGTCDAPTATDGMSLDSVASFTIHVEADATRTLSGTGYVQCYLTSPAGLPNIAPQLTFPITVSGVRGVASRAFEVPGPKGRIACVPVGIGVSAGGVTVTLSASGRGGVVL